MPFIERVLVPAAAGTLLTLGLVLGNVVATGVHPLNLVQAAEQSPAVEAVRHDFPDVDLPRGVGHDGAQFYAVARDPLHPQRVAQHLDRPRYRLQRIAFPLMAWALHPGGGGPGLIVAMLMVGTAGLFGLGAATAWLASHFGASRWWGAIAAASPPAYSALRLGLADNVALAFVAIALALHLSGRWRLALLAAVAAALTKESTVVIFIGLALQHRDAASVRLAAAPLVAAGAWWAVLHAVVDQTQTNVVELGPPLWGIAGSMARWSEPSQGWALAAVLSTAVTVVAVLAARRHHPLAGPVLASAALLVVLSPDALGLDFNAPRIVGPTLLLATLALVTPSTPAPAR